MIDCSKTGVGGKLVITTGCNEACTDGSVDTATQDTSLVVTNVGFDGACTVEVNNLLKCCSAAAGDTNCLASLAVAFVLQDAPIKCCVNYIHIYINLQYLSVRQWLVFNHCWMKTPT